MIFEVSVLKVNEKIREIFGFNGPMFSDVEIVGHCHRCNGFGPMRARDFRYRMYKKCMNENGVLIELAWVTRNGMFMGMDIDDAAISKDNDLPMLWRDVVDMHNFQGEVHIQS